MSSINDIGGLLGNFCMSYADLKISGAAAATISTTNAMVHTANGKTKSRAALSAVALAAPTTSTTDTAGVAMTDQEVEKWRLYQIPANKTAYIVIALDGASTPNAVAFQGSYDGQDLYNRGGQASKGKSLIPDIPKGFVPIGWIKVVCGSAAFTPATTNLDAANITFTFANCGVLPAGIAA